ncbi:MAG: division/cell wall cluster transcriptional repressor MraZ [Rhodospirillales bacterium]|jgi:MraZ protein|nr:division/cell wall cluster transcriptional repressor MraZ [Rhodospirillales bacterium]
MTQFLGTHQNKLDAKGRVSVPAPFRAALRQAAGAEGAATAHLVLRPSHKFPCIEAWPESAFQALAAPLDQMALFSDEHDDMASALYADAFAVETDREGRIMLPDMLVAHAALGQSVEFVGHGRIFRIWDPAAGARHRAEARARAQARGLTLPGAGLVRPGASGGATS